MKKNILFVVDEKCIGGVSVLLCDILNMSTITEKNNIDVLVLHNRGEGLNNLPKSVNLIYGTKYFEAVDLSIKEILKNKNIKLLLKKIKLILDLKTGMIKKRIIKERKKILSKKYDYEVAFKDGFTAIFTGYGESTIKYHWIQYDYNITNPNRRYPKIFKEILPKFDKIISVSEGVKKDFNKIYDLGTKVEVIENVVDINRIKEKAKKKNNINLSKNKINIICVGRLNFCKGYDRLIDVVNKLNLEGLFDSAIVRICGDGPERLELEKKIEQFNLKEKVLLCGMVSNPYKYYKNSDLFILPSRYEAFGLVIVEALALGVPVLATKNSATKSLIINNYNGLIVDNNDNDLYEALKAILKNTSKIDTYKKNLKDYEYNNTDILNKISSLFK